ncbi:hypothetical protein K439DRAFT_1639429 [Ramaria rubella]|nr:hypothetical protein K439DRAFT_1639429 [Ramaria rubella]
MFMAGISRFEGATSTTISVLWYTTIFDILFGLRTLFGQTLSQLRRRCQFGRKLAQIAHPWATAIVCQV